MLNRRLNLLALALGLFMGQNAVMAQDFLSKPVRIVVPQTPGGASDALARIVGQKLSEKWGQSVVIENRAGAGGNVGMEHVAQAAADGHTLLMSYAGSHAINAALYKKLPFDPEKDFEPVATLATLPFVLVVRPDSPVKSIKDLAEQGQRTPLTFGSAGNGSVNHLLGVMFNAAANTKLEHIPYRGAAPAMQDLMGGQINMVFTSLPSVSGAIKSGTLRPVAVTSAVRSGNFPNIPSIAESGFKEFDVSPWFGLFAPAKTPAAVVRRINQDVQEVLKNKDVIERFNAQGADVLITQPAEFAGMLKKTWPSGPWSSRRRVPRLTEVLGQVPKTTDLCDACDAALVCALPFHGFGMRRAFTGPIRTLRCHEDIGLMRDTVTQPGHGHVLVIDGGGSLSRALFGDVMAAAASRNGWAGLVIHGVIRDADEINGMDVGVKALGTVPKRGERSGAGELDVPVSFGGMTFLPGHHVVADADGVIMLPWGLTAADIRVTDVVAATALYGQSTSAA